jgi:anti-sigma factor RsiW
MIDPLDIQAYADGELSPEDRARVEREIAASESATAELVRIRALKSFLAEKSEAVDGDDVWTRCVSRLDELDRSRRVEGFVGRYAWGLCGLFFLVILAGGVFNRANQQSVRTGDVASYVAGLGPSSSGGVIDDKMLQVKRGLNSLLKNLQQAQASDQIILTGQREGISRDGRRVVAFDMRDSRGVMSLLVIPGVTTIDAMSETDATGAFGAGMIGQSNYVCWVDGGYALVLIGDRSPQELQTIGERIRVTASR